MPVTLVPDATCNTLSDIAQRVGSLYSLPAVANEVIELTNDPHVDNADLKRCIERDPALTVRVLRVVNSSLFGLSDSIADLNQALALLGVKPLKMLVLGFTLPDALLLNVAREQLSWYWRSTLARAVAAREISEQLLDRPGDEAFLAGLLQDVGVLALLGQLGRPYANLVGQVIADRSDLASVEREALGFDHAQLTARLLQLWNMPKILGLAIGEERHCPRLARNEAEHAALARALHLADLLAQLVAQCRLSVLPDLLETGRIYANLDKDSLDALVRTLDPKVRQLAETLSLPANPEADYLETLANAHRRLSEMTESIVRDAARGDPTVKELYPSTARDLRAAVRDYLATPGETSPAVEQPPPPDAAAGNERATQPLDANTRLTYRLASATAHARTRRTSLSVVLLALQSDEPLPPEQVHVASQLLNVAAQRTLGGASGVEQVSETRLLWILEGRDRSEAVELANSAIHRLRMAASRLRDEGKFIDCVVAAGVASVEMPTKNFVPGALLDAASRCLYAAFAGAGSVKSLVVS